MSLAPRRRQPSILLIGLRGSGKTYTGRLATRALGAPWRFIDADKLFEEKHGDLGSFVRTKGWEAFRTTEVKLLEELVERRGIEHVIALGGGVVESPAAREVLKSWAKGGGKVVYVERDLREVVDYLGGETLNRPQYGEDVRTVCERRVPWFEECCTERFVSPTLSLFVRSE